MNIVANARPAPDASVPDATDLAQPVPASGWESPLEFDSDHSVGARNRRALRDLAAGLARWRLGWTMGRLDIQLRYRGSVLGPFWLTLSTAVMIGALGVLYATLFHMNVRDYLPFLALSIVLWNFINQLVTDACIAFTQSEQMIRSVRMPYTLYACRSVVRNVLVLGHNIIVIVGVDLAMSFSPGWEALAAAPGLLLWIVDAFAVTLMLGAFCARFRDIPPIVGSVMQIAFYVTPIIWKPDQLGRYAVWLPLNPFFSILEVVRGPLLGAPVPLAVWEGALGFSVVLCLVAWLMFVRVRARVAFWV
jgi:lipopolysaccharide transport system permease protein